MDAEFAPAVGINIDLMLARVRDSVGTTPHLRTRPRKDAERTIVNLVSILRIWPHDPQAHILARLDAQECDVPRIENARVIFCIQIRRTKQR